MRTWVFSHWLTLKGAATQYQLCEHLNYRATDHCMSYHHCHWLLLFTYYAKEQLFGDLEDEIIYQVSKMWKTKQDQMQKAEKTILWLISLWFLICFENLDEYSEACTQILSISCNRLITFPFSTLSFALHIVTALPGL